MGAEIPDRPVKGRGATASPGGRFESLVRSREDDGWFPPEDPTKPRTSLGIDHARRVISTNNSPDVGFSRSINPYKGCEHGCAYCLSGDTRVLMADGTIRALAKLRPGDRIYGTRREGRYRRYAVTEVLDVWSNVKPAYRLLLADGTNVVTSSDHRFLTERGWKHLVGKEQGRGRRPHLTDNNKLAGTGAFATSVQKSSDYQRGYLCSIIRGEGALGHSRQMASGHERDELRRFQLLPVGSEALARSQMYGEALGITTKRVACQAATSSHCVTSTRRADTGSALEGATAFVSWPSMPTEAWWAGFLAGSFDADGSYSQGVLRISNPDEQMLQYFAQGCSHFGFPLVIENSGCTHGRLAGSIRLTGGLREHLRFFHLTDPAIVRKRDIAGCAVKHSADLRVVSIEPLNRSERLFDITTGTGDFIANGIVAHNCFARPTHSYLGLSPGLDFETRLFHKPDAPQQLARELAARNYRPEPIALGINTDAYQPVEREAFLTRRLLEVLAAHHHPVTIVTKSALVERDLDLLGPMAAEGLASVAFSITTLDHQLARWLEPRATAPARRVEAVRRLSAAGLPVSVLFAPVIPALNDGEMERVLEAAREAGARQAGYVVLRLPHELAEMFPAWLETHYPERKAKVLSILTELHGGKLYDARFGTRMHGQGQWAHLIEQRFALASRRLGFKRKWAPLRCDLFRVPGRAEQRELPL